MDEQWWQRQEETTAAAPKDGQEVEIKERENDSDASKIETALKNGWILLCFCSSSPSKAKWSSFRPERDTNSSKLEAFLHPGDKVWTSVGHAENKACLFFF